MPPDVVPLPAPWIEREVLLFGRPTIWQFGLRQAIGVGVIAILIAFVGLGLLGVGTHDGDYLS